MATSNMYRKIDEVVSEIWTLASNRLHQSYVCLQDIITGMCWVVYNSRAHTHT